MVWNALQAGKILAEQGIRAEVINIHTIKPLDDEAVLTSVMKTGCVVTAEEHMRNGGLGDSIAQLLRTSSLWPGRFTKAGNRKSC